jgi:hypothetical protein
MTTIPNRTTIDGTSQNKLQALEAERNNQEKVNLERHKTNIHVVRFHLLCKQSKRRG